jgi:hypothetical protein
MAFIAERSRRKLLPSASKERRPRLSQMLHVLLSEAILARQASEHQARKVCELTALLRGEHAEGTQS